MYTAKIHVLKNVIRHEVAHMLASFRGKSLNHDVDFRDICREFSWGEEVYLAETNVEAQNIKIEGDLKSAKDAASVLLSMHRERKNLEIYLEKLGKQIIPNTSAVAGPTLAFKLIAQAGGLDKIAKLPSSTIQLLGAEKALLRFLKKP